MQLHTKTPIYQIAIERWDQRDELTIYSREGKAPVVGGLLERNPMPQGGEAAMWTDAKLAKTVSAAATLAWLCRRIGNSLNPSQFRSNDGSRT